MTLRKLETMATSAQHLENKASAVMTVRVPKAVFARIQRAAAEEGITVADWHRDALLNAVRRAERTKRRLAQH